MASGIAIERTTVSVWFDTEMPLLPYVIGNSNGLIYARFILWADALSFLPILTTQFDEAIRRMQV